MPDERDRQLTGMITGRMWVVVAACGVVGAGLIALGLPLQVGAALLTLAILVAPVAGVATLAWLARRPATRIPRWLLWIGGVATAGGLAWLIAVPGHPVAIVVFGTGAWLLTVGIISEALVRLWR